MKALWEDMTKAERLWEATAEVQRMQRIPAHWWVRYRPDLGMVFFDGPESKRPGIHSASFMPRLGTW